MAKTKKIKYKKNKSELSNALCAVDMSNNVDKGMMYFGSASLQVYQNNQYTDEELNLIPKHDNDWEYGDDVKERFEQLAIGIEDNDNVFIYGPTGAGKTAFVRQMASLVNVPFIRFQFSTPITVEDFVGYDKVEIDEKTGLNVTRFNLGLFAKAWRDGYYIMFDEFTAAPSKITLRLQGPLEGDDLVIHEAGGIIIPKHPRTRIFATDNTNGTGDDTSKYVGTHIINEATLDRFGTVIKYDYCAKTTEINIIANKTGIDKKIAGKMVDIAVKVRDSFDNEECFCTLGTRRLIQWAKKTIRYNNDARKASEITILNKLNKEDRKFVSDVIQRHFGGVIL